MEESAVVPNPQLKSTQSRKFKNENQCVTRLSRKSNLQRNSNQSIPSRSLMLLQQSQPFIFSFKLLLFLLCNLLPAFAVFLLARLFSL